MDLKRHLSIIALWTLATCGQWAQAAATAEEAARLKSDLTPFGAERTGNREGTIPAWEGGYATVWPGYQSGQPRPDPFADEKPLFRITAANMDQYADKLSDGIKALLQRDPGFRLDVYPSHRTAAAPSWVYDNTFRNATRALLADDGLTVQGAFGGIPFPIPKSGREAMWNHLLAWKGEAASHDGGLYLVSGGKPVLTNQWQADYQFPYYDRKAAKDNFQGDYTLHRYVTLRPPEHAGEAFVIHEAMMRGKPATQVWGYFVGQRRVRPAPGVSYDKPDTTTSGGNLIDEVWLFKGGLDRYDWRLLGKQEIFVPYNDNSVHRQPLAQVLGSRHLNPEHVRWELHRVWIVEAQLASGRRHSVTRRRLYLDEDTWLALLYDGWDASGRLWHVGYALPLLVPELPAVVTFPDVIYDLPNNRYVAHYLLNEGRRHYQIMSPRPLDYFSPAALVSEGIR